MIEINETEYPLGEVALIKAVTDFRAKVEAHKLSEGQPAPIPHPAVEKILMAGVDNWVFKPTPVEPTPPTPTPPTYKQLRETEYPPIGDMVDAMAKALDGDAAEFSALQIIRNAVKAKYPKI